MNYMVGLCTIPYCEINRIELINILHSIHVMIKQFQYIWFLKETSWGLAVPSKELNGFARFKNIEKNKFKKCYYQIQ